MGNRRRQTVQDYGVKGKENAATESEAQKLML